MEMKYRSVILLLLVSELTFISGSAVIETETTNVVALGNTPAAFTTASNLKLSDTEPTIATTEYNTGFSMSDTTTFVTPQPTTKLTETTSERVSTSSSSTTTTSTTATTTESRPDYILSRRISSQLEEKLESLSCDLPLLPSESRLWKGNETHELLLPIRVTSECGDIDVYNQVSYTTISDCLDRFSWEGVIEMQSGDVLLVRIDDSKLVQQEPIINHTDNRDRNVERTMHEPPTAVYQVTRTGHDHCDVMEGMLLDITPLKVDNRKVVTLYDKDLTEGINLLIVVSELWGNQCVRLRVTVKSDNCGENEDCSGKGLCYSNNSMEGYECQCCSGFVGPHCEEQDACYPSPCRNNGICVDISQGHEGSTFQCLCPYGYTGKICEETTDPCTSMPCQNGATCFGNVTHFFCQCPRGFLGPVCQHNENECESSPCVHGICVDQEDSYKCFCQPGFTGNLCETEYNECESSPCAHGGTCTDRINGYSCACTRGYAGKRCEIKVDLCEPNPCPDHRYCMDQGNNYTCECPKGYSDPDCSTPVRAACSNNPCTNGGTCWSSMNSFYCACRPGFTGKTCEDEFVVETITNTDSIGKDNELDLQMPISIHLDHLHNVYIAAGTLACAFVIVALIVTVCHCRVNKTYKRFMLRAYPLWICKGRRAPEPPTATNSEWFSGKDKAPTATPSRSLPSLDTTDMYYTLDFSDSQSSPLIQ